MRERAGKSVCFENRYDQLFLINFDLNTSTTVSTPRVPRAGAAQQAGAGGSPPDLGPGPDLQRISDVERAGRAGRGSQQDVRVGTLATLATGEQWDASLTTGVDWRSITFPACLPITTDYIPDRRAFDNDYVVNQYALVPEELTADYVARSALQRPPLTTQEVFLELVSQRLSQGFQLIIPPGTATEDGEQAGPALPSSLSSSFTGAHPAKSRGGSIVQAQQQVQQPAQCFRLSIGRNFHLLRLAGNTIQTEIYRPRHPYPALDYHYR